jgi:hypothetical protein
VRGDARDELLDEQRIARGQLVELTDELRRHAPTDQPSDLGRVEPSDHDPLGIAPDPRERGLHVGGGLTVARGDRHQQVRGPNMSREELEKE